MIWWISVLPTLSKHSVFKWSIKNTPFEGIFHTAKTCFMYFREFYNEWLKPTHMSSQFFKKLEVRFFIKIFDDVFYFSGFTIYFVLLIFKDFSEDAFSESSNDATLISKCFAWKPFSFTARCVTSTSKPQELTKSQNIRQWVLIGNSALIPNPSLFPPPPFLNEYFRQ